jgi:hypothetical protein
VGCRQVAIVEFWRTNNPDAWPSRLRIQLVAETEDLDAVGVENCGFDQVDLRSGTRNPAAFSVRGNHYDVRPNNGL